MLTNSSDILTHPFCTPNGRIKTTIATLYSSTFFYRAKENSRKGLFDAGKLQNTPSPKERLPMDASNFTTLAKDPSLQGKTPAMVPLLQAGLPQGIRHCRRGSSRKNTAPVEQGTREW